MILKANEIDDIFGSLKLNLEYIQVQLHIKIR